MNTQFDLKAMLATPAALQNAVKQIPCEMLKPYHNHRFEMYSGERLDDMIASIKANGVLCPIVVQPSSDGKYEILIGHNRWNASREAGLPSVPAIIKEGLSPEEAEMYVVESNLLQRGFDNLKISEQAAVVAERHDAMFSQGKRNDIIREIRTLEGTDGLTLHPMEPNEETGFDSSREVGAEYGLSKASVVRLLRVNALIDDLKKYVDDRTLAVRSAVEISFLNEQTQKKIAEVMDDFPVDMKKAKLLRDSADEFCNLTMDDIIRILDGKKKEPEPTVKGKAVKISHESFKKYFKDSTEKDIYDTIERALELYFEKFGK